MDRLLRRPSAFLPIAMSLGALSLVAYALVFHVAKTYVLDHGVMREDEGAAAHVFQLLMAGQLPIIAFFAVRWLPAEPIRGARVIAAQLVVAAAAFGLLYVLEH